MRIRTAYRRVGVRAKPLNINYVSLKLQGPCLGIKELAKFSKSLYCMHLKCADG